jgi:predicted GNAT family acetyltransferase
MDQNRPYFSIMEEQEMIAIVGLWVDEMMGIINIVATDPDHRRKGYATSLVSTGVQ